MARMRIENNTCEPDSSVSQCICVPSIWHMNTEMKLIHTIPIILFGVAGCCSMSTLTLGFRILHLDYWNRLCKVCRSHVNQWILKILHTRTDFEFIQWGQWERKKWAHQQHIKMTVFAYFSCWLFWIDIIGLPLALEMSVGRFSTLHLGCPAGVWMSGFMLSIFAPSNLAWIWFIAATLIASGCLLLFLFFPMA